MHDLPQILNWRRLSQKITTSGQPTEPQLADIKELGVTHIINLGPHTNKGALPDEAGTVAQLGMTYIYIPVDFSAPTEENFQAFCAALDSLSGNSIHVHCIYNARVSAFFYRRAKTGNGGTVADAFGVMDGIWRPGGVWAKFIGDDANSQQPHQYAGYEYNL